MSNAAESGSTEPSGENKPLALRAASVRVSALAAWTSWGCAAAIMVTSRAMSLTSTADRGKMCAMACHVGFPYIDILRYGGTVPGNEPGTAKFCCPEVDTLNVWLAEIVEG